MTRDSRIARRSRHGAREHPVLQLQRTAGNRAVVRMLARAPKLTAGAKLAVNPDGTAVTVKREVGAKSGYAERLEAFAAARMANADPAVIVQTDDKRWRAVETNVALAPNAKPVGTNAMTPLPTHAEVATLQQQVDAVHRKLQSDQSLHAQWEEARTKHAAAVFGVGDPNEVRFNVRSEDRQAGKINVNTGWLKDPNAPRGAHGPVTRAKDTFDPTLATALEVHPKELADHRAAAAVLFHEQSHLTDYALAQRWVGTYKAKKGDPPLRGELPEKALREWLKAQAKAAPKQLSQAEAELVFDLATDSNAATEARAYIRTFLAALQLGAYDEATKQVVAYAKSLKKGGDPVQAPTLKTELLAAMKAARGKLDKPGQAAYDAAMASAKSTYRGAWFV